MPYVNHAKQRKTSAKDPEQQEVKRKRQAKGAAAYILKTQKDISGNTRSSLEQIVLEGTAKKPKVKVPKSTLETTL